MYNDKITLNSMRTNIIFKNSNIVIAQIRDFLYENVWLCAECLGCCYRDDVMDDYDALTTHSNSKFTANIEMITKSTNFVDLDKSGYTNLDKSDTENNKDVNLTQNIECENENKTDKNVLEQAVENIDTEIQEYDYVLYPKLDIETSNENNEENNEKNDYDIISELNKNTLTI